MKNTDTCLNTALPDRGINLGLDSRMQLRYDITRAEFDAYITALKNDKEYCLLQENSIGENAYLTLSKGDALLHVSYTAVTKTVRLITDNGQHFKAPPLTAQPYTGVTDTTLCVLSPDYTHREITDGNGMSFAVILADGRYLVIDGGYPPDAARIYRFLCDNNKRQDGKVVIAAWLMTHAHSDHYGAFREFAKQYADKVTLEGFIMDPTRPEMLHRGKGYNPYLTELVFEDLARFGTVELIRPRTGHLLHFCDTVLEIYYTAADHLPRVLPYMNDASITFKLHAGGQTVLFMADCEKSTSELICDIHGAALKSDIIQVNHHGYSGGTVELYQLADPTYSLWPTCQVAFDLRVIGQKYQYIGNAIESNKYLFDTLGREHCIVADGPAKLIKLPLGDVSEITYYAYE